MTDETNNTNNTNNKPAEPAAPAETTAPKPSVDIVAMQAAHQAELAALRAENDSLRLQKAVHAVQPAPTVPLGTGSQDARREQAIRAAGGLAYWNLLPPQKRAEILGISENVSIAELNKYFGKNSSIEAASLAKLNPSRYRALRILAREYGI